MLRNHHPESAHPYALARAAARDKWNAEIDRLTLASLRDDKAREQRRRVRVLKPLTH